MAQEILVFQIEIPIRWGDMDAMGHVNNTIYFRYMEQARIGWFDAMGFKPEPLGTGPIIINASCTFIKQFEYPGTVVVKHYLGAIGRSSFDTHAVMSRTDDPQTVYADGAARCVWIDFPKQKSTPLPDDVKVLISTPRLG